MYKLPSFGLTTFFKVVKKIICLMLIRYNCLNLTQTDFILQSFLFGRVSKMSGHLLNWQKTVPSETPPPPTVPIKEEISAHISCALFLLLVSCWCDHLVDFSNMDTIGMCKSLLLFLQSAKEYFCFEKIYLPESECSNSCHVKHTLLKTVYSFTFFACLVK